MPAGKSLLSRLGAWRCPQCSAHHFSTSASRAEVGPEHPRYIKIPRPPQQEISDRRPSKGTLPIPRDIFSDLTSLDLDSAKKASREPKNEEKVVEGSREEWKQKMSEKRRQNLREGTRELQLRQLAEQRRTRRSEEERIEEAHRLQNQPQREDERLTNPSHSLDLHKLLHGGPLQDPTRDIRLRMKRRNVEKRAAMKKAERLESLHALYMRARHFIVTPEQLHAAVEEAFEPSDKKFEYMGSVAKQDAKSFWDSGPPLTVQKMLSRSNNRNDGLDRFRLNHINKIAETLTGGKMEETYGVNQKH